MIYFENQFAIALHLFCFELLPPNFTKGNWRHQASEKKIIEHKAWKYSKKFVFLIFSLSLDISMA